MKLLVVDDSRVMRRIIARTLRQAGIVGHDVVEGENGADGLAKALSENPDLILSDWDMPEMNGLEFLTALRRAGSNVPFGLVSSEGSSEAMRAQAYAAGAMFVISKPVTADKFESALTSSGSDPTRRLRRSPGPRRRDLPVALPTRQSIRETFEMLMGRPVKAGDGDRVSLDLSTGPISVGTILDDNGRLVAVIAADLPLSVRAGACLGLLPAAGAQEMVESRHMKTPVDENFFEVLNVLSSTFNIEGAIHVRFGEMHTDPTTMPPLVLITLKSLSRRDDLRLDIGGYGAGNLSVVLVDDLH